MVRCEITAENVLWCTAGLRPAVQNKVKYNKTKGFVSKIIVKVVEIIVKYGENKVFTLNNKKS